MHKVNAHGQGILEDERQRSFDTFTQRRSVVSQNVGTLVTTIQTHVRTVKSTLALLTRVCQSAPESVTVLW